MNKIVLRPLKAVDCTLISQAFQKQGWDKPVSLYEQYLKYQEEGQRDIIIAEVTKQIAGYLTIAWESEYQPFREKAIPEVVDFNVFKKFQRQHIGSALMDEAERRINFVSRYAGIGFGLTQDYGAAQILYVKRAYIPDGRGITKDSHSLTYGEKVVIDDDLVLHLVKKLY